MTRPLIGTYDCSDVAIQDRRKQQQRFREAQLIQREMSQLERQYEELEEVGSQIEQALRDAESSKFVGVNRGRGAVCFFCTGRPKCGLLQIDRCEDGIMQKHI